MDRSVFSVTRQRLSACCIQQSDVTRRWRSFPQQFIDDLKHHADIVVVVQDYVSLKKTGATYKGLCPFHGEKTPSFHVNRDKGFFHCFGCGVGGDVFKFLELHDKVGFQDAVKQLAQPLRHDAAAARTDRRAARQRRRARGAAQGARGGGRVVSGTAGVRRRARGSAGRLPTAGSAARRARPLASGLPRVPGTA